MTLKTLLLGSAAAMLVAGGAQAADLSVAEPVDYVRVCDAFGVGYWYIPGTDTCIKVGGFVEFQTKFHNSALTDGVLVWDGDEGGYYLDGHGANWQFVTEAGLNFTAKSMTEYGELTGFVDVRGKFDNIKENVGGFGYQGNNAPAYLDSAWLSLGPLLVGHTASTFDYAGGFSDNAWRSDTGVDQVRLSWAMSGFGIMLGVEDPRDRWGTSLSTSYSMPDLVAAVTASQANWDGKVSVGFSQLAGPVGSVYGINAGITIGLDGIAPGDKIRLNGAFGTGSSYVGGPVAINGANNWSAFASFQHFWSPTLSSAITGTFASTDAVNGRGAAGSTSAWGVGANLVWAPVSGFAATLEGTYVKHSSLNNGDWAARVILKRSW